jgi:hypothetical protein
MTEIEHFRMIGNNRDEYWSIEETREGMRRHAATCKKAGEGTRTLNIQLGSQVLRLC